MTQTLASPRAGQTQEWPGVRSCPREAGPECDPVRTGLWNSTGQRAHTWEGLPSADGPGRVFKGASPPARRVCERGLIVFAESGTQLKRLC